ncbi:BZ3501_MvSof-1269-A2-R1_Chr12-3g03577 [Microbotryum saponariae]|nr:BZ3501_MvSof-1269-A2-R1_Chr12-3g03577 [Microbotryum saponariae]
MDRLRQVVNLLENYAPNHLQLEYDTMQAKRQAIMYECKLKDTRPILKLPLYIDTEENILQCAAEGQRYRARMLFTIEASNVSVALIYILGDHEGRVTLESVRKPATVMRTIARQIVLRCGSTRNTAFQEGVVRLLQEQIKRRAYVLDVIIHTRLRCDMESEANSEPPSPRSKLLYIEADTHVYAESVPLALRESLLELEVKPLGSPKVEIFAPTPVLIDPSIVTMDTSHSNFDPQRTTPLVSRNPRSSPAPSSATIGLMPATPPMRLQRVVKGRPSRSQCGRAPVRPPRLPMGGRTAAGLTRVRRCFDLFPLVDSGNSHFPTDPTPSLPVSEPLEVVGSLSRYQRRTLAARSTIPISASAQVLANRSTRGKNPLSKLRGFAQALHSMSGSQDKFNVEVTCSSCKKRSEIVDPKPCHDE